jgi:hypothetical protein
MMAYCPAGMEQRSMFQYMYLQRLPCTLQTMPGEQEPGEIRCLAASAGNLSPAYGG